ncbi:hypothetical protein CcaverHIS002_0500690 [Cutaneotrichosporon cavernicola]|uniref:Uncharacterized protein n=1 Tax=Cutaneotrichosporon cavernicola TaxID=279322 RepID=A0AA48L800_9TREE|nr:uncharacterized protein CcaverHIS019_0600690 [Cutaneotrichosporon cavernicola]BEI84668.1 hypothetical protein CcaverHIS002_0500690 [Cutaneotrichosporon cavernicola]BEI93610.1 hypothetical protein CcaverHIS019_0600690 [Cutaneotrichosporon cavernicola]BEJ01387.1 hypothetical protein CcaverHIS631_0600690 [Cutaneotrichosporon cavernicola]BEJ09154.1 hypothetical protein CcaverHIS641_0600690 [Cutaneotrichosporon cavernicola]
MYLYRPRFGIFRRLVWFGLGVGAAHWWIRSKDRHPNKCYRYQRPIEAPNAPAPAYAWPSAMTPSNPSNPNPNPNPDVEAPTAQEHVASETSRDGRRFGWHRRHSPPAQAPTSTNPPPTYDADTQAEIDRLQRVAEALWEQRKTEAIEATVAARETARDFAVDNLKRLTELLQRIGSSIEEEKRRNEEQKKRWV